MDEKRLEYSVIYRPLPYLECKIKKEKPNYTNIYIRPPQTLDNWIGMLKVQYLPKEESDFDFINNYLNQIAQNPQVRILSFYPEISIFSYGVMFKNGE